MASSSCIAPSNSFLLTTSRANSWPASNTLPKLTIFAKNANPFPSFRPGKSANDEASLTSEDGSKKSSFPFQLNFGNLSDMKSLIPVVSSPTAFGSPKRKDPGTVFVAGATGQVGARIAQTLLREGFRVRAGVPDLGAAQDLARFASDYKLISDEESKRLNAVESAFNDSESIARAIGNASKIVVTIGPTENGPTSEVTTSDAIEVIEAAQLAGVSHVAIVYDDSTFSSSTYNVLDGISSFFNNLLGNSKPLLSVPEFLQKLIETDVRYTFIKTRLGDDFLPERSFNFVVAQEGSAAVEINDYKVSRSRMASLVADLFANTAVAENKVAEVYVDPSAPARPVDELFSLIPEDGRRKAYTEAIAKAKAEEEAVKASEKAREAAKKLEEEAKRMSQQEAEAAAFAEDAKQKAEAAGRTSAEKTMINKPKGIGNGLSWEQLSSQIQAAIPKTPSIDQITSKVQIATVRGQAKAQNLPAQKAVVKPYFVPKAKTPVNKKVKKEEASVKNVESSKSGEVRRIFGGLFKQETIYIDDD